MINKWQLGFLLVLLLASLGAIAGLALFDEQAPERPDPTESLLLSDESEDPAAVPAGGAAEPDYESDRDRAPEVKDPRPRLYLVLDDAGQAMEEFRRFSAFPGSFTVAVLPFLPYSEQIVRAASAMGHEAILHQPMEAYNGEDPGPGAIFLHNTDDEIRTILRENLERYPHLVGVNNHMGSRATSDERVMETVLAVVRDEGLFFLDSRTTHTSVAPILAARAGMPVLSRHFFLDHERSVTAINEQLDQALAHARRHGFAIMIGHVTVPETADILLERYGEIEQAGFEFLPLSHAPAAGDVEQLVTMHRGIDADSGY